jgi:hypothetical protein
MMRATRVALGLLVVVAALARPGADALAFGLDDVASRAQRLAATP